MRFAPPEASAASRSESVAGRERGGPGDSQRGAAAVGRLGAAGRRVERRLGARAYLRHA